MFRARSNGPFVVGIFVTMINFIGVYLINNGLRCVIKRVAQSSSSNIGLLLTIVTLGLAPPSLSLICSNMDIRRSSDT